MYGNWANSKLSRAITNSSRESSHGICPICHENVAALRNWNSGIFINCSDGRSQTGLRCQFLDILQFGLDVLLEALEERPLTTMYRPLYIQVKFFLSAVNKNSIR